MTDDARRRRCDVWTVAMLVLGLLVALVPPLAAGDDFIYPQPEMGRIGAELVRADFGKRRTFRDIHVRDDGSYVLMPPRALAELVQYRGSWAAAAATLLAGPLLFLWWRRSAIGFGRVAGVACCVAASGAVCAVVLTHPAREFASAGWAWCFVPLGGAMMAAAFVAAPAPLRRDDA